MTIYNEDAEEAVLSAVMLDPESIVNVPHLKSDAFYLERHRHVFDAMQNLHASGKTIDPLTLTSELERAGTLQAVGGKSYLSRLMDAVPTSANISHHAAIVRETAQKRNLITLLRETAERVPDSDPSKLAAEIQQSLLDYAVDSEGRGFRPMREIMLEVLEQIEERGNAARDGRVVGVTTGYPEIDDVTNGWRPGELVTVFAGPKSGKTAFTLSTAIHNSLNGDGVGFVCAEMTRHSLAERCINAVGRIRTADTSKGIFAGDDWRNVVRVAGQISSANNFFVDDEAFPELGDVIARALHLKSQNPNLKYLVVDYLQLITHRMKNRRGDEEIHEVCKGLKGLAKRGELVVIAPGQTNYKEVDARAVPRPTLRDVQGSSGPAQTSDFLFLAYRDPMVADSFELECAASRRTDRFTVNLIWAGKYMRIESPRAIQFGRTTWESNNAA